MNTTSIIHYCTGQCSQLHRAALRLNQACLCSFNNHSKDYSGLRYLLYHKHITSSKHLLCYVLGLCRIHLRLVNQR